MLPHVFIAQELQYSIFDILMTLLLSLNNYILNIFINILKEVQYKFLILFCSHSDVETLTDKSTMGPRNVKRFARKYTMKIPRDLPYKYPNIVDLNSKL